MYAVYTTYIEVSLADLLSNILIERQAVLDEELLRDVKCFLPRLLHDPLVHILHIEGNSIYRFLFPFSKSHTERLHEFLRLVLAALGEIPLYATNASESPFKLARFVNVLLQRGVPHALLCAAHHAVIHC